MTFRLICMHHLLMIKCTAELRACKSTKKERKSVIYAALFLTWNFHASSSSSIFWWSLLMSTEETKTHTDTRDGVGMMVGNFWAVANWIKQIFIFLYPTYMRAHIHSNETCFKNWVYASSYIAFYHFTCSPFLQSPATNKELFSVFLNCFISLTISFAAAAVTDALLLNIATFVTSGEKKKTEKCKNCHGKTTSMNKWWHFMTITAIAIDEK